MTKKTIYKTTEQIEAIRKAGSYLNQLLLLVRDHAKEGVSLIALEQLAEAFVQKNGIVGSFKGFQGFPANLCLSVNECVVHGIPDNYCLKNGDLLKIDAGVTYNEGIADSAISIVIGGDDKNPVAAALVRATKEALDKSLPYIVPGRSMYDFGKSVYTHMVSRGFKIIKNLTGHGVGVLVHEGPIVYNRPHPDMKGVTFQPGMVLALEPITSQRSERFVEDETIPRNLYTEHKDLGAQREYTLAVTASGYEILAGITE